MMKTKINNQGWTVGLADCHDPKLIADGVQCMGCTWCGSYSIWVSKEIPLELRHKVLIHEITHAYMYMTQAYLPEHLDEEFMCNFFEAFGKEIIADADRIYRELLKEYPGV